MKWRNSKAIRIVALVLGLLLVTVAIAACGDDETTTTAGGATTTGAMADLGKFSVIISSPAVFPFYEVYVAESQGFFEKRGLEVEILEVDGSEATTTAFAAGQGQIMQGDLGTLNPKAVSAMGEDYPIMFFAFMTSPFSIYVPDDSEIMSAEELDGKVVGVNSEQDPGMSLIRTVENTYNITIEPLITVEAPQAMAALDRGDAVAYASSSTGAARIEAAGGGKMRSVIPQEMVDKSGVFGYWATRKTMDANPEAMKAFVAGLQEARAYINDEPQKLYDWYDSVRPISEEEVAFRTALAPLLIDIRTHENPLGSIDPAKWQVWWDTLVANETIDASIGAPTDFYTNEFFQ